MHEVMGDFLKPQASTTQGLLNDGHLFQSPNGVKSFIAEAKEDLESGVNKVAVETSDDRQYTLAELHDTTGDDHIVVTSTNPQKVFEGSLIMVETGKEILFATETDAKRVSSK